jgi:hypothetical protein
MCNRGVIRDSVLALLGLHFTLEVLNLEVHDDLYGGTNVLENLEPILF